MTALYLWLGRRRLRRAMHRAHDRYMEAQFVYGCLQQFDLKQQDHSILLRQDYVELRTALRELGESR